MVVNTECDNTFEGEYLNVISIENDSTIYISPLKDSLFLSIKKWDNWALGWGNDIPLYDAGSENLFSIKKFNPSNGLINLGKLLRGKGFPLKGTRVVLWNRTPSGFEKYKQGAIVKPSDGYFNFAGNSLMYSKIIFDSINKYWVMFINEVDTNKIDMYATISYDLIKWEPALDGKPVFTYKDFLKEQKKITIDEIQKRTSLSDFDISKFEIEIYVTKESEQYLKDYVQEIYNKKIKLEDNVEDKKGFFEEIKAKVYTNREQQNRFDKWKEILINLDSELNTQNQKLENLRVISKENDKLKQEIKLLFAEIVNNKKFLLKTYK
ncbi:hypothetical protein EOM09_05220, partial [bacterium]|nr:hypothetical protein [bacterium]